MAGYPALVDRRLHYEIDGSIFGHNGTSFGNGMTTLFSAADLANLNGESPTVDANVLQWGGGTHYFFVMFPELVDLEYLIARGNEPGAYSGLIGCTPYGSPDTTNGIDGTWTAITTTGTIKLKTNNTDWWRSTTPGQVTANGGGLKGLRFSLQMDSGGGWFKHFHIYGQKTSGQTPDDLVWLQSDGSTEWTVDKDYGDLLAGGAAVTQTMYLKNVSGSKTASTIDLAVAGSDSARVTISLDDATYAATRQIASLAPGASQVVYVRFTPPAAGAGVYRPHACYVKETVSGGWA